MISPITMVSAAKYAPVASCDVPCDQLRKETRAWLPDGSSCYTGAIQKWTAGTFQPFSGTVLKNTGEGKSS